MILVDTNVWSEALKPRPDEVVRTWARKNEARLRLSAVVLAELRAGAALLPVGKRRSTLEAYFGDLAGTYADRMVAFDAETALHYAAVLQSAKARGRPIGTADAMIAASAIQHGMLLATRDGGDFAGADVRLVDPWSE